MRRLSFLLFAAAAILFLAAGCSVTYKAATVGNLPSRFVGKTHSEIVREIGAPIQTQPDGTGGYILVYEGNKKLFRYNNDYARAARQLPTAQFFMSPEGVCTEVITNYEKSVTEYSPTKTLGLLWFLSQ